MRAIVRFSGSIRVSKCFLALGSNWTRAAACWCVDREGSHKTTYRLLALSCPSCPSVAQHTAEKLRCRVYYPKQKIKIAAKTNGLSLVAPGFPARRTRPRRNSSIFLKVDEKLPYFTSSPPVIVLYTGGWTHLVRWYTARRKTNKIPFLSPHEQQTNSHERPKRG